MTHYCAWKKIYSILTTEERILAFLGGDFEDKYVFCSIANRAPVVSPIIEYSENFMRSCKTEGTVVLELSWRSKQQGIKVLPTGPDLWTPWLFIAQGASFSQFIIDPCISEASAIEPSKKIPTANKSGVKNIPKIIFYDNFFIIVIILPPKTYANNQLHKTESAYHFETQS